MARIIVAEDDLKQADLIRSYLERDGHSVVVVHDGRSAIDEIRRRQPDLVLLDIMMPHVDGLDVMRVIRVDSKVPIIMVTARSTEDDQLLGFDLGADDYITKPYSLRQMVARVRAVLRRSASGTDDTSTVSIGGLQVDKERAEVRLDGRLIELTPRELAILETLAEKPGRVFSRQQLLAAIAGFDHYALERTVDMHVANLRKKIETDPADPRFVVTVKGRGYKLAESTGDAPASPGAV